MFDVWMAFIIAGAYLIGSIPSGYLIARYKGIENIREHGSGNIGATNVARVLGIKFFFIVFFTDFFKAWLYLLCVAAAGFTQWYLISAAIALLIGNGCSLFLGFRGGKAVATGFGVLAALHPYLLLYLFVSWLVVFALTKTVALASIFFLLALPAGSIYLMQDSLPMISFTLFTAAWGIFLHRENIAKLGAL